MWFLIKLLVGLTLAVIIGSFIFAGISYLFSWIAKNLTKDKEKASSIGMTIAGGIGFLIFIVYPMTSGLWYDTPNTNTKPPTQAPKTFYGYPCTSDCSGHEAGFEWAEENDVRDARDCSGRSSSFIEGCRAYAENNSYDSPIQWEDNYPDDPRFW